MGVTRKSVLGLIAVGLAVVLPGGAQAGFSVTSIAGVYQDAGGAQVQVYKSSNGNYLGDLAQAATIQGCPAAKGHTVWIIDGNGGRSAKVYAPDCSDSFSTATFAFGSGYVRVCTAEPGSSTPPSRSAPAAGVGAWGATTGCGDLKQLSAGEPAGQAHTAGDYIKKIRRGRCVLKFGPTSFFVRIANVADDKAVKVLFSNNGRSAETGQKSGKEFRFDLPAKKGANHVKVTVKTFHGKTYTKKKTLYC